MKTAPLSTRLFKTRTRPEPGRVWPVLAIALATFGPWHPVMRCAQRPIAPPAAQAQAAQAAIDNVQKGYRLLAQKSFAAAEAAFRHAIAQDGQLAEAHHGLGVALWREGKNNEALQELTRATQLKPTSAALELDLAKAAWSLADQARSNSQTPDSIVAADSYRTLAIAAMQKAASLETRNAGTHLSLAVLYLEAHKPKEAVSQAREAATLDPSNASAFVILGRAELAQGNEIQAATQYEKAVQLNPRDGQSYVALGELRARQGNYAEAEKALRAAIQSSPKLGPAYAMLGEILERNHQTDAARSALEQAISLNPDDWESAYQLGKIAAGAGKADQATLLFERALRIRPDFPAAREQLALGMVKRDDLAGAAAQAETISTKHPQAPEGHRVMALVLWKQRNYDGSLAECAQALTGDPQSAVLLAVQALDLWQEGQRRQARQAFVAASKVQRNIGSADVFCRLVVCDARDVGLVEDFLRKNRWALGPQTEP